MLSRTSNDASIMRRSLQVAASPATGAQCVHSRAGADSIVKKRTCGGTAEVWLASRIGKSAREHPDVTSAGRTDIYLYNGRDREEGPVNTARSVSAYSILFLADHARQRGYTYRRWRRRRVQTVNRKGPTIQ